MYSTNFFWFWMGLLDEGAVGVAVAGVVAVGVVLVLGI